MRGGGEGEEEGRKKHPLNLQGVPLETPRLKHLIREKQEGDAEGETEGGGGDTVPQKNQRRAMMKNLRKSIDVEKDWRETVAAEWKRELFSGNAGSENIWISALAPRIPPKYRLFLNQTLQKKKRQCRVHKVHRL